ncbi:phage tail terminator protein [Pseudoroseicyclus sp. H15]
MLPEVKARLQAEVTGLHSIGTAGTLAALVSQNTLPQQTPAAILLPLGLRGAGVQSAAGSYTQATEEVIGVLLVFRITDPTAATALEDLGGFRDQVIAALAGWAPDDTVGVFALRRAAIVAVQNGIVTYQIEMAITDQLRIDT